MQRPLIGFIGFGCVGRALAIALGRAGYPLGPAYSPRLVRTPGSATPIEGVCPVAAAQDVADAADLVIIATSDRVIADVAAAVRWRHGAYVVHTSGGTPVAALDPAAQAGAETGGWHPLNSFAGGADDANLGGITFAIEAAGSLRDLLHGMTESVGAHPLDLRAEDRVRYHASAALASNALVALLGEAAALWSAFGWSREDALAALLPLVRGTVRNLETLGVPGALTGPVERGDADTVQRHLSALADAPKAAAAYRRLSRTAVDLALEKGGITRQQADALTALLSDTEVA